MRNLLALIISVALLPLAVISLPALAQDSTGALEEVTVTAQRREQNLQDVPISVTAFTGAELERSNIKEAAQYLNLSPNVSYTEDGQSGGTRGINISIRGVSNINTDESAFIQSVGIYLDEFSVASTANTTINPNLYDLARVEVLRGPQGTYFGRNAVGGALNLTTTKPTELLEGYATLGGSDYHNAGGEWNGGLVVNVPLSDTFFVRGVAYYEDSSGLVKNIVPNGGDSGHEYVMFRGAARWLISDSTTADLMYMYSKEDQGIDEAVPSGVWDTDTVATFLLNNPYDPNAITEALDDGEGFWPHNQNRVAHTAIGEQNDFKTNVAVLNIAHQFNEDVVLKWISGIIDVTRKKIFDNDLVPEDLVRRYNRGKSTSWSSELRLEVSKDGFDWITGVLYSADEIKTQPWDSVPGGGLGVVTGITTGVDLNPFLGPVPGGNPDVPIVGPGLVDFALTGSLPPLFNLTGDPANPFFLYNLTPDGQLPLCLGCNDRINKLNSVAVFSDFTFHATDKLDLTVGARYTLDDVYQSYSGYGLFRKPRIPDPSDPTGLTPLPTTDSKDFDDLAPRFSAAYQVSDDANLYATISKGYKAGGFTLGFNGAKGEAIDEPFKPETLWNYEVGFKSEWLDNRLRLNAAAFHLDWSDLQLETIFFAIPGDATSNINKTINVRDATADGAEVELALAATDRLTFTGGLGYLHTEIKSDDYARLSGNLEVALEGEPLPRSPEWTGSLAADYSFNIGSVPAWVRGEFVYRDSQFSTIEDVTYLQTSNALILANPLLPPTPDNVIGQVPDRSDGFPFKSPSVELFNFFAGLDFNANWKLQVFVENVFDKDYYTGSGDNFGLSGFRLKPHPRNIGATVTYTFGGGEPAAPSSPPPPPPPPPAAPPANPDLDGDGVLNEKDKCPNTRPGAVVDLDGCEVEAVISLEGVHFGFDESTLTPEAQAILDKAVALLDKQQSVVVEVAGHTDSVGSEEYNQKLSERRAVAVKDYLESKGITATRLTARGYGEAQPVASNDTDAGRALNRRVELIVLSR